LRIKEQEIRLTLQEHDDDDDDDDEKKWKNIIQLDRLQMTIWRMPIACWIPKATTTHP